MVDTHPIIIEIIILITTTNLHAYYKKKLVKKLRSWPDTSVVGLLQNMEIESESATQYSAPLLKKYSVLLQKGNTPFEYEARGVANVRRLWSFLIHQDDLAPHFVRFIFARLRQVAQKFIFIRIFNILGKRSIIIYIKSAHSW